jgi:hypothetical protein
MAWREAILRDTKVEVIPGILLGPYVQCDQYTKDGREFVTDISLSITFMRL